MGAQAPRLCISVLSGAEGRLLFIEFECNSHAQSTATRLCSAAGQHGYAVQSNTPGLCTVPQDNTAMRKSVFGVPKYAIR